MQNRTLAKEKAAALSELPGRGELGGNVAPSLPSPRPVLVAAAP